MLGKRIEDPDEIESRAGGVDGLGWLPVRTVLESPKVTRTVTARTLQWTPFRAYEIHMGRTEVFGGGPFAMLCDGSEDGCTAERVFGTYLHGAFDDAAVARETLGLEVTPSNKAAMYDRLGAWLLEHANPNVLEALLAW